MNNDIRAQLKKQFQAAKKERLREDAVGSIGYNFKVAVYSASQIEELRLSEPHTILSPWLTQESLIMIAGERGIGKTWFALAMAKAISEGKSFGPWENKAGEEVKTLYFDGELPTWQTNKRVQSLRANNLHIYNNSFGRYFAIQSAKLSDPTWLYCWEQFLVENQFQVWILDNLSSVTPGLDENSKEAWSDINYWLLGLRNRGIATIFIHHTGKNGQQRGTSSREDNLDGSILLKRCQGRPNGNTSFEIEFTKMRFEQTEDVNPTSWKVVNNDDGTVSLDWKFVEDNTKQEIIRLFDNGNGLKAAAIARKLNVTQGYVSQILKRN